MSTNAKPRPDAKTPRKPLIFVPPEKRCLHQTQSGAPCRAARWRASRFCIFHDPNFRRLRKQLKERRHPARGQKSARTAEAIQEMLERAAQDVREKRLTPAEASSIGYLGQVMSANLKNLPQADVLPIRPVDTSEILGQWADTMLNDLNEEIARWVPASSPLAVAKAGLDPVRIAADASAAEAKLDASKQAAQNQGAGRPPASQSADD